MFRLRCTHLIVCAACLFPIVSRPQDKILWSAQEKPIEQQLEKVRDLPDDVRGKTTHDLALEIRKLPPTPNKVMLATWLVSLATEGDLGGPDTMQEVATTLADAIRETPPPDSHGKPDYAYTQLAQLILYEGLHVNLNDPKLKQAEASLKATDQTRQQVDWTLNDVTGKSWTLSKLRGRVVLLNFWATWCPPCRKEMPDLSALYTQFKDQGLVILAISYEDPTKVKAFLAQHPVSYPILLDPGRKVNKELDVLGIPRSLVYNREGHMVAEAIDMRTRPQLLEMLAQAGLK